MNADNPLSRARAAPRCRATSKRTGKPCGAPAMRSYPVCYHHGARGGAPRGPAHGRYRHGGFTCDAVEDRSRIADLIRKARALLKSI